MRIALHNNSLKVLIEHQQFTIISLALRRSIGFYFYCSDG